ncbi:MAG: translation initiation factor IF-3 C-terminal domain-containing protein [Nostocales cyanobacterium W4_Combined_metabat2_030]|nr:translation initiation factor IF-3 C-terminal domain-containing protein [Nostocales cyanobacterium W4_Combined_metabat2_030]
MIQPEYKFIALIKADSELRRTLTHDVYATIIASRSIIGQSSTEGEEIKVEFQPKLEGRQMIMVLVPKG